MNDLLAELLPHAPQFGLFAAPSIPEDRLRNALRDFARGVAAEDIRALYDATLLGNGKDGAVFTADRVVFQNNSLEPVHDVYYRDLVGVESKRKLLGGRQVQLDVNRGRATFSLAIDCSGRPEAAEFMARFLKEAMLRGAAEEMDAGRGGARPPAETTDVAALRQALSALREAGRLTADDYARILRLFGAP